MKKWNIFLAACALGGSALASSATADFNDLSVGDLNGQGGGAGLSGTYTAVTTLDVISGNLSTTLYNLTQSGTAQSVRNTLTTQASGQSQRSLGSAMSGTIWVSMVASNAALQDRGGFSFNPGSNHATNSALNVVFYNTSSNVSVQVRKQGVAFTNGYVLGGALGDVNLLLVRTTVDGSALNEVIDVWLNPNVALYSTEAAFLANVAPTVSYSGQDLLSSVTSVGLLSYASSTLYNGSTLDNFRMSNAADAFWWATGVGEAGVTAGLGLFMIH